MSDELVVSDHVPEDVRVRLEALEGDKLRELLLGRAQWRLSYMLRQVSLPRSGSGREGVRQECFRALVLLLHTAGEINCKQQVATCCWQRLWRADVLRACRREEHQ